MSDVRLTPLEYAVFGALCAGSASPMQDRIDKMDDAEVYAALQRLLGLGWIRQLEPRRGMARFEVAWPDHCDPSHICDLRHTASRLLSTFP